MHVGRRIPSIQVLAGSWTAAAALLAYGALAVVLVSWGGLPLVVPSGLLVLLGLVVVVSGGIEIGAAHVRLRESRQRWGEIVHLSRTFGMLVLDHVRPQGPGDPIPAEDFQAAHRELVQRHVAWLTALRHGLRARRPWEHHTSVAEAERRRNRVMEYEEVLGDLLEPLLLEGEADRVLARRSPAAHLLVHQGRALRDLSERGLLDDRRHLELERLLQELSRQQGQCERLKASPLPRPLATWNRWFVRAFLLLLPFGMLGAFDGLSSAGPWLVAPLTALVGGVFHVFGRLGQASENPTQGLGGDTPISAWSRAIEIDLREMLGDVPPPPLEPVNEVLS